MRYDDVGDQVVLAWRVNNRVKLNLLRRVPARGFAAVPSGSKGRTVSQVCAHTRKARVAWLKHNGKGFLRGMPLIPTGVSPSRGAGAAADV